MADQKVRNGLAAPASVPGGRMNNGVFEGVSSFGNDLATLAGLQVKLVACDLRDSTKSAAPLVAGLVALGTIAGASAVVGLTGFSLWLATVLEAPPGVVMMAVALGGLVIASLGAFFIARSLGSCFAYFRRSQEELERNIAWIKTTLVHSGR
ncbi:phage holin family protein [Aquisphaera insulae]|uniref:phage holin family protein n=1 Tax=Aquisphaera insulae TaxID=2712864 RepID=UPI0013EE088C|nr:phage holin family protein [Aquisphaera insulae]